MARTGDEALPRVRREEHAPHPTLGSTRASGGRAAPGLSPGARLFLVSFVSLFLELLLIRWTPSLVRVLAYYGNLLLISAFLGLGTGSLLSRRELRLHRWFAEGLLVLIAAVFLLKGVAFRQGPEELRFLFTGAARTTVLPVAVVFVLNTLVFVPLGELIGGYFRRLPPLRAYGWDLGGAIVGTAAFGVFSFFWFSPLVGFGLVMACYLSFLAGGTLHRLRAGAAFLAALAIMVAGTDPAAVWSPYSYITVKRLFADRPPEVVTAPPAHIGLMPDPPFYIVEVNHDFYMMNGSIDARRYTRPSGLAAGLAEQYLLPYQLRPGARSALVVGSGGGTDVEAALLADVARVDAVEIDPVVIAMGRRYNASRSYLDPRVTTHTTDARAFFRQTRRTYDMVVFGFLDSQGLFSQMSSIRLDGYVYTRESFREAFRLLAPGGLLSVSFFAGGKVWLIDRLIAMVRSATGVEPLVYGRPTGQIILLAGKGFVPRGPERLHSYRRVRWGASTTAEAVDDWPFLYLRRRAIPPDYLVNMGVLVGLSLLLLLAVSGRSPRRLDLHFFLLGAGFMLLETRSVTALSLYFGSTWLVSTVVILGVLVMVLLANLVASRQGRTSPWLYLPLLAVVGLLYVVPPQVVLAWSIPVRLAACLVVMPLPIFFAGLVFSTTFRDAPDPSFAFGSNLVGAVVGGFVEYLGMVTGTRALLLVAASFYATSLLVRRRHSLAAGARA